MSASQLGAVPSDRPNRRKFNATLFAALRPLRLNS